MGCVSVEEVVSFLSEVVVEGLQRREGGEEGCLFLFFGDMGTWGDQVCRMMQDRILIGRTRWHALDWSCSRSLRGVALSEQRCSFRECRVVEHVPRFGCSVAWFDCWLLCVGTQGGAQRRVQECLHCERIDSAQQDRVCLRCSDALHSKE
jgi:hypothetical protein